VTLGTASVKDTTDWVRYIDSKWDNGKGDLTWELGNELWGNYQVGYPNLSQAADRTLAVSSAVRAVDPSGHLIATGGDAGQFHDWNAELLKTPASTFQYLSSHFIITEAVQLPNASADFHAMALLAAPWGLSNRIDALRQQAVAAGRPDVKFAFTEWLMITFTHNMPNYSNLGGALFAGGFLNTMLRKSGDVALADMTGILEFGGIWKKKEQVYASPAYWVLRSYAQAHPHLLLNVASDSPTFSISQGITQLPEVKDAPYLDVVAAESEDRTALLLFCVNRNPSRPESATFDLAAFHLSKTAQITTVAGDGLLEENDEYHPERVSAITQDQTFNHNFDHTFPAASVTVIRIAFHREQAER
jgi:alpha-L-arabinofuranosidase